MEHKDLIVLIICLSVPISLFLAIKLFKLIHFGLDENKQIKYNQFGFYNVKKNGWINTLVPGLENKIYNRKQVKKEIKKRSEYLFKEMIVALQQLQNINKREEEE